MSNIPRATFIDPLDAARAHLDRVRSGTTTAPFVDLQLSEANLTAARRALDVARAELEALEHLVVREREEREAERRAECDAKFAEVAAEADAELEGLAGVARDWNSWTWSTHSSAKLEA